MKSRHSWRYSLAFAVVNFGEALVLLCTLGRWCPSWVMNFVGWYMRRHFSKRLP